jgi:hypothetical protein
MTEVKTEATSGFQYRALHPCCKVTVSCKLPIQGGSSTGTQRDLDYVHVHHYQFCVSLRQDQGGAP